MSPDGQQGNNSVLSSACREHAAQGQNCGCRQMWVLYQSVLHNSIALDRRLLEQAADSAYCLTQLRKINSRLEGPLSSDVRQDSVDKRLSPRSQAL